MNRHRHPILLFITMTSKNTGGLFSSQALVCVVGARCFSAQIPLHDVKCLSCSQIFCLVHLYQSSPIVLDRQLQKVMFMSVLNKGLVLIHNNEPSSAGAFFNAQGPVAVGAGFGDVHAHSPH